MTAGAASARVAAATGSVAAVPAAPAAHGGERIARALQAQGVERIFTLCGGHISPILSASKALGIRIVDVRDEVTAVFAADATARLTGRPGVAAVTAGPGGQALVARATGASPASRPCTTAVRSAADVPFPARSATVKANCLSSRST